MPAKILTIIEDMGYDLSVTAKQIDEFVDDCIKFLRLQQECTPGLDLLPDIFELEAARQDALIIKYSTTIQE